MLNAIGGTPMMDAPGFIPQFPLNLPLTNVSVSIKPFDRARLASPRWPPADTTKQRVM